MAIQTIHPGIFIPAPYPSGVTGQPTLAGLTGSLIDAAAEKIAICFVVPRDGVLNRMAFEVGSVTNNPDNGLRISFQDLSGADPDGTQDQFRTIAGPFVAGDWVTPGLMTDDGTDTGVKRTVAKGDRLACVLEFESFVAADSIAFGVFQILGNQGLAVQEVYNAQFGAAWAQLPSQLLSCALEYETDGYVPILDTVLPATLSTSFSMDTGTNPDEVALRFRLPFKATCDGCWFRLDGDGDWDLILYDSDGSSVLASRSFTAAGRPVATGANHFAAWDAVTLQANTTYRLAVKPTTLTNIATYWWTCASTSVQAANPQGAEWYRSHRIDGGAWTDVTTERPWAGIRLNGIDDGAGGDSFVFNTVCPMIVPPRSVAPY